MKDTYLHIRASTFLMRKLRRLAKENGEDITEYVTNAIQARMTREEHAKELTDKEIVDELIENL